MSADLFFISRNPATGEAFAEIPGHGDAEVERRLARAASAFAAHRRTGFAERSAGLSAVASILEAEKRELGELATREMGKPIGAAVAEVEKCAWACRFYAEHAERFLGEEPVATDADASGVRYDPLGPVLAVMPWNFPFWQVFRFAAPALAAGNVGLLKHAANVPQCALAIESIFRRAGFADGAFQTLLVPATSVEALISDRRVAAVTLTGSEAAGAAVGAAAGRALKKVVLELGGSDPFLVLPSADLAQAVATAVAARTINNGESCIAAKRFVLHAKIAEEFERWFVATMGRLVVGDPMDPATQIGPLATASIRDQLALQVERSVAAGARLALGGRPAPGRGYFFPPSVLADPPAGSPAAEEELFGPVASLFRVRDFEAAIALANSSSFGLGAAVWTSDPAEQARAVRELEAGSVFVNGLVKSDPRLPFGGVKRSGFGRELALLGIREFVNAKTFWVARARE